MRQAVNSIARTALKEVGFMKIMTVLKKRDQSVDQILFRLKSMNMSKVSVGLLILMIFIQSIKFFTVATESTSM